MTSSTDPSQHLADHATPPTSEHAPNASEADAAQAGGVENATETGIPGINVTPEAATAHRTPVEAQRLPNGRYRRQPFSFVRRGDRLSPKRQKYWDKYAEGMVLEIPRVMTDTSVDPEYRLDQKAVFGREAPLVVEIGSGLGEAIVNHAKAHPEMDHLAVEVYSPGIADLLQKAAMAGVTNVRVAQANAPEVLDGMLEPGSVREVWVFFPDPWHKTKHHKRRLVSPSFVDLVAGVLEPGGLWRLATDWQEYAVVMREVIDARPEVFENLHPGPLADEGNPQVGWAPRWDGRILTSFERKALEAGRTPRDLTYRKR